MMRVTNQYTKIKAVFIYLIFFLIFSGVSLADESPAVLAKVNGSPITSIQVEAEVNRLIPQTFYHKNIPPEKQKSFREQAINTLIDMELQYQEAKTQGIKADKKKAKTWLKNIKKRYPSNKEFKKALKKNNISLKDLKARIHRSLMIENVFKKEVDDKISIEDEEIKAEYDNNVKRYKELDQVRLRYIVIMFYLEKNAVDENQITRNKEEAKKLTDEILGKISKGEDFASLAYQYSDSPFKVKGGDMGYIHKGRILPDLESEIFSSNIGDIIGPREMEDGFHIFKVEDRKHERQLSFDEVKDKIKNELTEKKKKERISEWFKAMKNKAKIEYLQPVTP